MSEKWDRPTDERRQTLQLCFVVCWHFCVTDAMTLNKCNTMLLHTVKWTVMGDIDNVFHCFTNTYNALHSPSNIIHTLIPTRMQCSTSCQRTYTLTPIWIIRTIRTLDCCYAFIFTHDMQSNEQCQEGVKRIHLSFDDCCCCCYYQSPFIRLQKIRYHH